MAIADLDKITLYGAASRKDDVIRGLQGLGCVHLTSLSAECGEVAAGAAFDECREALKYLRACKEQTRQVRRPEQFDRKEVVSETVAVQRREQQLRDERDELGAAIADLQPWGEFQLPPAGAIGDVKFWFYVMPLREADQLGAPGSLVVKARLVWKEVSRDSRNARVVLLSGKEPADVPGQRVQLDPRPLSELNNRLEEVDEELAELHHRRVGLTRWSDLLALDLDRADDTAARQCAARLTLDQSRVFAIQGWVPTAAADRLRRFAAENDLAFTSEPSGPDDEPPTLLENPEAVAGGEGLVTFYKTPQYGAWDPSIVVYVSFAVFFAMILADAGYAAVIGLLAARYWKRMGQTVAGRRGRGVLATLAVFSVIYGVLCGSYFGVAPSQENILGALQLDKLIIVDAQSQAMMMPLTVLIGVIHLSLAHLVMAWQRRGHVTAFSSLGWVAVMLGGTAGGLGLLGGLQEPLKGQLTWLGSVLLLGGLVAVFLCSSERPLLSASPKNHILRVLDGLKGLTDLSGLFGDVLSYLRLFALGLSSAKLAQTFNSLAQGAWDSAGFGVLVAIAIVLLGHTLNLLLCIMSGVVHGLRLNCIEFFKWSLPEEGYLFSAFAKKARES